MLSRSRLHIVSTEAFCESGEKSWVDWVSGVVSAGMSEEVLSLNNSSPLIIFSDWKMKLHTLITGFPLSSRTDSSTSVLSSLVLTLDLAS